MTDKSEDFIDAIEGDTQTETASINSLEDAAQEHDHDALAKFAEEAVSGGDPDDTGEDDVAQAESGELPADDATETNDKAAADKDADTNDKTGDTDTKAADDKAGEQTAGDDKAGDDTKPAGVLTKDGKHWMSYQVLEDTRKRAQTAESHAQQLERENQELKERLEKGAEASTEDVKLSDDQQSQLDAINTQIGKIEEEYGEELAAPLKASLEMQKAALMDNARLRQEVEDAKQAPPDTNNDEAKEVQAAIDANPVMATWQARGDDWYQRSVEVYNTAIANDPDFAAMSREQQFAELPNRVQALYGKDKTLPEVNSTETTKDDEGSKPKADDTKQADKTSENQPEGNAEDFAGTMSDIPGGAAPEGGKFGPVENASSYKLQQLMDEAAEKGNLDQFIDNYA